MIHVTSVRRKTTVWGTWSQTASEIGYLIAHGYMATHPNPRDDDLYTHTAQLTEAGIIHSPAWIGEYDIFEVALSTSPSVDQAEPDRTVAMKDRETRIRAEIEAWRERKSKRQPE